MNLKELIAACKNGDQKAQKAFFMHFSGSVFGQIMRYMGNEFAAKDVLQNVFLIMFKALSKFEYENEAKLRSWIKTITVRESIRALRYSKFNADNIEDLEEFEDVSDSYDLMSKMRTEDLLELLKRLPEGYRLVFNMYAIEGYSHKEIAMELGISESTSRSQLSRARQLLQKFTLKMS